MENTGKYRGWKKGEIFGVDLGNNKKDAIKTAKKLGLDHVLKINKLPADNEFVYEK